MYKHILIVFLLLILVPLFHGYQVETEYIPGTEITINIETYRASFLEFISNRTIDSIEEYIFFGRNFSLFCGIRHNKLVLKPNLKQVKFVIPPSRSHNNITFELEVRFLGNFGDQAIIYTQPVERFKIKAIQFTISGLVGPYKNVFVPFPHPLNNNPLFPSISLLLNQKDSIDLRSACPECQFIWLVSRIPSAEYSSLQELIIGYEGHNPGASTFIKFEKMLEVGGQYIISLVGLRTSPVPSSLEQYYNIQNGAYRYYVIWSSDPIYILGKSDTIACNSNHCQGNHIQFFSDPYKSYFAKHIEIPNMPQCSQIARRNFVLTANPTSQNSFCIPISTTATYHSLSVILHHSLLFDGMYRVKGRTSIVGSGVFSFPLNTELQQGDILCMGIKIDGKNHLTWKEGFLLLICPESNSNFCPKCYYSEPFSIYNAKISQYSLNRELYISSYDRPFAPDLGSEYIETQSNVSHKSVEGIETLKLTVIPKFVYRKSKSTNGK